MNYKIALVFAIALAVLLSGCTQNQDSRKESELHVAVVVPQTGPVSQVGQNFLDGMLLAKEKINNQKIILHVEDSQSNAKDGVTAVRKILDTQKVDVIVSLQSAVVIPILSIADEYNKPVIATAISYNEFTQKSINAFRLYSRAEKTAGKAAEFANKRGFKNISIITIMDEYGKSMKENFKKNFKGKINFEEDFVPNQTDFRTELEKISESDAVYFIGYNVNYVNFLKQRKELNKKVIIISHEDFVSNYMRKEAGELVTNGYAVVPVSTLATSKTSEFSKEFEQKYGKLPDWTAPFGYDAMLVLDAVQKSGKDPKQALYEIKIEGINGTISFDQNREANTQLVIVEAKNGNIEEVKP